MQHVSDTCRSYRTGEHTFTSYNFGSFNAILSNKRLIINHKQSSESIQLQQIKGVSIVDDYEQYRVNKARCTRKIRKWYHGAGLMAGSTTGYFLSPAFFPAGMFMGAIAGLVLSSFLPITTKSVATPSLLLVITDKQVKEYSFLQHSNSNVAALARFLLLIEEALYR